MGVEGIATLVNLIYYPKAIIYHPQDSSVNPMIGAWARSSGKPWVVYNSDIIPWRSADNAHRELVVEALLSLLADLYIDPNWRSAFEQYLNGEYPTMNICMMMFLVIWSGKST